MELPDSSLNDQKYPPDYNVPRCSEPTDLDRFHAAAFRAPNSDSEQIYFPISSQFHPLDQAVTAVPAMATPYVPVAGTQSLANPSDNGQFNVSQSWGQVEGIYSMNNAPTPSPVVPFPAPFSAFTTIPRDVLVSPELQCRICRARFKRRGSLRSHMSTHKAHRELLPCTQPGCSRSFLRAGDRTRHVKSKHSHPQKYPCQYCGNGYSRPDLRDRHEKNYCETRRQQLQAMMAAEAVVAAATAATTSYQHSEMSGYGPIPSLSTSPLSTSTAMTAPPTPQPLPLISEAQDGHGHGQSYKRSFPAPAFSTDASLQQKPYDVLDNPEIGPSGGSGMPVVQFFTSEHADQVQVQEGQGHYMVQGSSWPCLPLDCGGGPRYRYLASTSHEGGNTPTLPYYGMDPNGEAPAIMCVTACGDAGLTAYVDGDMDSQGNVGIAWL
ncbi:hypothetical protein ABEF95_011786 [Exophiala dermatitidis]